MKRSIGPWLFLLLLSGCTSPAILTELSPGKNETCYEQKLPVPYQLCIYDEKSKNPDVLYYLHGTGDWVHSFTAPTATDGSFRVRENWLELMRQRGGVPRIVTISFGRSFLLNKDRLRTYLEVQKNVEKSLGQFRHRLLWGFSMGGHNALRILFTEPEKYHRAVIAAPNFPRCNPFVDKTSLYLCTRQERGKDTSLLESGLGLGTAFQVRDSYDEEEFLTANPLVMATKKMSLPPIYLTVGDDDQFGFLEGTRQLHAVLQKQKANVTYHEIFKGKHNEMNVPEIVDFLLQ